MNPKPDFATWFGTTLAAIAIAGCSAIREPAHRHRHADTPAVPGAAAMSAGTPDGPMDSDEMKAMCDMHKKMMGTKPPEGSPAIIDERMKSMSPDMLQKHMMMMRKCQ